MPKVMTPDTEGFVYFVEAPHVNRIKIGFSASDPETRSGRLDQLRNGSPIPLRLMGYIRGTCRLEKRLHERFARLCLHYEWFSGEGRLRGFIEQHKGLIPPRLASSSALVSRGPNGKATKRGRKRHVIDETPPISEAAMRAVDDGEATRQAKILVGAIFGPPAA